MALGEEKNVLLGKPEAKRPFESPGVEGRIILL